MHVDLQFWNPHIHLFEAPGCFFQFAVQVAAQVETVIRTGDLSPAGCCSDPGPWSMEYQWHEPEHRESNQQENNDSLSWWSLQSG